MARRWTGSGHYLPSAPGIPAPATRITPTLGAGVRVAVLEAPDTDSAGASRPGTRHPLLFQVVTWPATDLPDVTDPGTEPAVAALLIRSAMFWTMAANGYGQPMLECLERITGPGLSATTVGDADLEANPRATDPPATEPTPDNRRPTDVVGAVFVRRRREMRPWAASGARPNAQGPGPNASSISAATELNPLTNNRCRVEPSSGVRPGGGRSGRHPTAPACWQSGRSPRTSAGTPAARC